MSIQLVSNQSFARFIFSLSLFYLDELARSSFKMPLHSYKLSETERDEIKNKNKKQSINRETRGLHSPQLL